MFHFGTSYTYAIYFLLYISCYDNIVSMKSLHIKDIPEDLAIKVKVKAALLDIKIKDLVIAALEAYLDGGVESWFDPFRDDAPLPEDGDMIKSMQR